MAPRLAVVVSQAPMRNARVADIEETIVADLIMVGGLDATLVGPLERILPNSTDLLCLSGFTQDLALLSWMPTEEAATLWSGLNLTGTFVPMSLDGSAAIPATLNGGRRIFYIQLTSQSIPSQVCQQLKARLELLRVQPVSLQLKMTSPMKATPTVKPTTNVAPQPKPLEQPVSSPLASPLASPTEKLPSASTASDSQWKNLDQLVDELDSLDL